MANKGDLVFFVNGKKITLSEPDPEVTLLQYLRTDLQLTGTKMGCGEGGCGACTVMVSFWSEDSATACHYSANACLMPLCSLHGKAVTTVEGIGSLRTRLHPVQERIAACHGTQCGYCTPGFVMSMYTLLRNNPTPCMEDLNIAFQGNLCRCTGYRPIIDAYRPFTKEGVCALGDQCCRNKSSDADHSQNGDSIASNSIPTGNSISGRDLLNGENTGAPSTDSGKTGILMDPTQELIFPPCLKLEAEELNSQSLVFVGPHVTWYRPTSLTELLDIKKRHPECRLVIGYSVEVKARKAQYQVMVSTTHVVELTTVQLLSVGLRLGASVTLTTMDTALKQSIADCSGKGAEKTRVFSAFVEMLHWFAGPQIRNVAALGGNIMTASPISDLNPLLLACGAHLEFISTDGSRRQVKMDSSFFKGYRTTAIPPEEILLAVVIPFSSKNEYMCAYKQASRKEDDMAIVNAGMRVVMEEGTDTVRDLTLAFGGMGPTTVMATRTMTQLLGQTWNKELLEKACDLLTSDLPLDPGAPGGMVEYRRSLAVSFFFKFYLTVLKQLQQQGVVTDDVISPRDQLATQPLERGPSQGLQWFDVCPVDQSPHSALRRPIVHESAYKHATGEAVYIGDMPPRTGELQLGLVLSSKARARLVSVDPSVALSMPGVVDYISNKDIPAQKTWTLLGMDHEEIFASGEVISQGQVIGAILADTRTNAQRAAKAVVVEYDVMEPIITIADAIEKDSFWSYNQTIAAGDVEEAWSRADLQVVEGEVHVEAQEHFYLETQVTLACPTEDLGMEIFCSTQTPAFIQESVAKVLGVSSNKVKCRTRRVGGAFGGKEQRVLLHALPTVIASNKHNCPVRCVLDRDEDMMMTGTRHPFLAKYKMGVDSSGKLMAFEVLYYVNAGSTLDVSPVVAEKALLECEASYHVPNLRATARLCRTNIPSCSSFRGFGAPQAKIVMETALVHAAAHMGITPEKIREASMCKDGDLMASGMAKTESTLRRCWDDVMEQSKFTQRREEVDRFNSENQWRKRGIAITPTTYGISFAHRCMNQGGALVNIYKDGSVIISHGGVEMGQGLHIKVMQVASQALGIPVSKVQVEELSTSIVPNATTTAASSSSDLYGGAVLDACNTLMERLKPVRAQLPDCSWEKLIFTAYLNRISLSATGFCSPADIGYGPGESLGHGNPSLYFTYGSACSMVELDCLTGDHQVLSTDIVMDVGKSLNPAIDIGQIEGAFLQGYGLMMLEQYKVQGDGTLLTRGPGSYKIPSAGNIPQTFNVSLLQESGNPKAVYSSKAVGEPPLLLASSVLCATHDAIRAARLDRGLNPYVRLDTPATPARIRMACSDRFTQMFEGAEKKSGTRPWFVDL